MGGTGRWRSSTIALRVPVLTRRRDKDKSAKAAVRRTGPGPPSVESSPDDVLMIGHGDGFVGDRYSHPFLGLIDEVRISNTARTAAWIKTQHNTYDSPSTFYTVSPPL